MTLNRFEICGVAALLLLTGLYLALSEFQQLQNADSIVPVLVSLQRWTPFFWETNRYGMLIPLLAMPFRNPLTNLIVETALGATAAMACSFLLVRYFFEDSAFWWTAAALQNIWLLALSPGYTRFDWMVIQCYGTSLSLAFGSLILVHKRKYALAVLLMMLSEWVNFSGFVFLVPLILLRHLINRERKGLLASLSVTVIGTAFGYVLMRTARYQTTVTGFAPLSTWVEGWKALARIAVSGSIPHPMKGLWVVVPATVGLLVTLFVRFNKRVLMICAAFLATAIGYWLFTGTLLWVRENVYGMRYVYPSMWLLVMAAALVVVAPFQGFVSSPRSLVLPSTALVLVAAVCTFGSPSVAAVRASLNQRFGKMTPEILNTNATAFAGDYWTVWPTVFETDLALYDQHQRRMVYGRTYRGSGTAALWVRTHGLCIDAPLNDADAKAYINMMGRPFALVKTFHTIEMYCTTDGK